MTQADRTANQKNRSASCLASDGRGGQPASTTISNMHCGEVPLPDTCRAAPDDAFKPRKNLRRSTESFVCSENNAANGTSGLSPDDGGAAKPAKQLLASGSVRLTKAVTES